MKTKAFVSIIISAVMLTSCSNAAVQTSDAVITTEITESTTVPFEVKTDYAVSDPEIEEDKGLTKKVNFYRDGNLIRSKITLPEGDGPFKTIIVTGGLYATLGIYSGKTKNFVDNGYAVVEISPTNNKVPMPYKEPDYLGDFVYDQMLDIFAVMDELKSFQEIDQSGLYLFGHSMGGLATTYAGILRQDKVKGMILVEPSFQHTETMKFENDQKLPTDFYSFLSGCNIPVLIIKGTGERPDLNDFPHFYDKAGETLPDAKLITIDGADHQMSGEFGSAMSEKASEIINEW